MELMPDFPLLGNAQIVVVQSAEQAAATVHELLACSVVGFDTESKPTFEVGEVSQGPHVVQFATLRTGYIFQLHLPHNREAVAQLLAEPRLTKAGFGLDNDRAMLLRKFGVAPQSLVDLDHRFRQRGYGKSVGVKAAIALLFGQRFAKSKKTSTANWARMHLTEREVAYAANDAYGAMCVFDALERLEAREDAAGVGPAASGPSAGRSPRSAAPPTAPSTSPPSSHAPAISTDPAAPARTLDEPASLAPRQPVRGQGADPRTATAARSAPLRAHGGPDGQGAVAHDFSTNANDCGPCPQVLAAVQAAEPSRYPDPGYHALRERLAAFHGVAPERVLLAASGSEFIFRITAWTARRGGQAVSVPRHAFGDYADAAHAWGFSLQTRPGNAAADGPLSPDHDHDHVHDTEAVSAAPVALAWHCDPSSPLGQPEVDLADTVAALAPPRPNRRRAATVHVLDRAYEPLRLDGASALNTDALARIWQLWSPNKALGLTGVRAAYAIAPMHAENAVAQLESLAPSWPVGAHGVAMLDAWCEPEVQAWVADSVERLRAWKARQIALCESLGWQCLPSVANFFCARMPQERGEGEGGQDVQAQLAALRAHGIQLRDAASFGLPGWVRLAVLRPVAQDALARAWAAVRAAEAP